jgi:hypothetical protein
MKDRLFVFGRFANDPQRILTAIYRLALVGIKLCLNAIALELCVASFTDADGRRGLFYDPQFALCHDLSLAQAGEPEKYL